MKEQEALRISDGIQKDISSGRFGRDEFLDLLDEFFSEGLLTDEEMNELVSRLDGCAKKKSASKFSRLFLNLMTSANLLSGAASTTSCTQSDPIPYVQTALPDFSEKQISNSEVIDAVIPLLKREEGSVLGTVTVDGKKYDDMHVVYDDSLNVPKSSKKWDGNPDTLDSFLKNCKGVPTIGYGLTGASYVNRGFINSVQAESYLKNYLSRLVPAVEKKVGENVWKKLGVNQRAALVSLYYNVGIHCNTPKTISFLRQMTLAEDKDHFKFVFNGFKREFADCNKVKDKESAGLTNRRKRELEFFEKDFR